MAQNDALTFYVKFMEDKQNDIKTLVDKITQSLKGITIKLDSRNIDVSGLKAEMGKLEGVKVVDQKSLTDAEKHIKKIAELLEKAFNGKNGGEKFTGMLRALVEVRTEVGKVVAEMGKMSSAISSLGSGLSANLGNAIVNNMTRINEAVDKSIGKLAELNKAIEGPGKTGTPKAINDAVNIDMAKAKIAEINSQLASIWKQLNASFKLNFDTGKLDEFSMKLQKVRSALREVIDTGGGGKRVDEILRNFNYGALKKDASNEVKAVNEVSVAVEKLKAALDSLADVKGVGELRKKLSDLKAQLEYIGKDPAGIKMQQSEHVNRYLTELLKQAKEVTSESTKGVARGLKIDNILRDIRDLRGGLNDLSSKAFGLNMNDMARNATMASIELRKVRDELLNIKNVGKSSKGLNLSEYMSTGDVSRTLANARATRNAVTQAITKEEQRIDKEAENVARAQQKEAEEVARAQRIIQKEIDASTKKFNELYAAQTALRTKGVFGGVDVSKPLEANQQRLTSIINQIRQMESMMNASPQQTIGFAQSKQLTAWRQEFEAGIKTAQEGMRKVTDNLKIDNILSSIFRKMFQIEQLSMKAGNLNLVGTESSLNTTLQMLERISQELEKIKNTGISSKGLNLSEYLRTGEMRRYMNNANEARSAAQKEITAKERANRQEATNEINRLKNLMKEINAIQAKSPEFKLKGVERAVEDIQRLIRLLEQAKAQSANISRIQGIMGDYGAQRAPQLVAGLEQDRQAAVAQQVQGQQAAAHAADQHAQAQQRMEQAIANATGKAQQQSQVLSDLRSMAAQYLSVWGASSFIKEIAQVTGELELQKKSLSVILDSASQAQSMFNQVKTLSQMSPYTFQDMLKSTRQLAAFGVETKNLYGTMKSLSDLGAGLDVDVQRLILAYGHVKSAGVLSGIQRRQFETAGINITGEIAKLYNERYKQAGSEERVGPEDIFKMIKDRKIGFEDVEQAITRMTAPGGRFYNMQLRQFETLGGKLRNLRNNYNIMLDEIGKSYNGLFSGGVDTMNSMMENWRTWEKLIKSVTVALVAAKVASMALGKSWTAMRAAQNTMRQMRYEAQALGTPMASGAASANYAQAIVNNKDLNKFQKLRAVLRPSVSADDRYLAASMITGNQKYAEQVKGMNKWQLATQRLKLSFQSFFSTMKAGFMALATNPLIWLTAAVAAVTALTSKARELEQMRETATRNAVNLAGTDIREMVKDRDEFRQEIATKDEAGNWNLDDSKLNTYGMENAFKQLDEMLQKYDPLYKGRIFGAKMIEDEKERVLTLFSDLEAARQGKQAWKESAAGVFQANSESGYGEDAAWWNLGLKGNWGQWDTAIDEAKEAQQELLSLRGKAIAHQQEIYDILFGNGMYDNTASIGVETAKLKIKEMMDKYNLDFEDALSQYIKQGNTLKISAPDFEIDNSDFNSKVNSFANKAQGMINVIANKLNKMAKNGAKSDALANFVQESINGMFSMEGMEITDPDTANILANKVMERLKPPEGASKELAASYNEAINMAFEEISQNMANAKISEIIEQGMQTGDLFVGMDPAKFAEKVKPQIDLAIAEIEATVKNPALRKRLVDALNSVFKNVSVNPRPAMEKYDQAWKRLYTDITNPNDPRRWIVTHLGIDINAYTNETSLWVDINKKIAEIRKKIAEMKTVVSTSITTKLNLEAVVDASSAKRVLLNAYNEVIRLAKGGQVEAAEQLLSLANELYAIYKGYAAAEMTHHRITPESKSGGSGGKKSGGSHKRDKPSKSSGGSGKKSKGSKGSSSSKKDDAKRRAEDAEQRRWDENMEKISEGVNRIEEARREFRTWIKRGLNDYYAAMKVVENFKKWGLVGEGKLFSEKDMESIKDYNDILAKLRGKLTEMENYAKTHNKDKMTDRLKQTEREAREIAKASTGLESTQFDELREENLAAAQTLMEDIEKQWDLYEDILDKTKSPEIARMLAGIDESDKWYDALDKLEQAIDMHVKGKMQAAEVDLQPDVDNFKRVNLDEIVGLSDKDIEKYVRNKFGVIIKDTKGDEIMDVAAQVDALAYMLKQYKRAYNDAVKKSNNEVMEIVNKFNDYASVIGRINKGLERQIELINKSAVSEEEKNRLIELERRNTAIKILEASPLYSRFMDSDTSLSGTRVSIMTALLESAYRQQFLAKGSDAETYMKKISEILSHRRDYYNNKRAELLDTSTKGRLERELKKLMGDLFDTAEELEKARERKRVALEKLDKAKRREDDLNTKVNKVTELRRQAKEDKELYPYTAKDEEKANELAAEIPEGALSQAALEVQRAQIEVRNADADIEKLSGDLSTKTAKAIKKEDEIIESVGLDDEMKNVIDIIKGFSEAIELVTSVLQDFGVEEGLFTDFMGMVGGGLGGMEKGMKFGDMLGGLSESLGNAGPWGAALGAALGIAGQIAQIHDKRLQRRIDEIKQDTEKMSNTLETIRSLRERTLGYDNGNMRSILAAQYQQQYNLKDYGNPYLNDYFNSNRAASAMYDYYSRYGGGSGYSQELKLLQEQREKIMEMYDLEDKKKKTNKEELENYRQQISELDEQIRYFTEDLANELWGIDLKGWADQIGDALMTAFENGTSAASAFRDSVQEIMRDVVKNMLSVGIIQPYMEKLRKKLFGENGQGGLFDPENAQGTIGATLGGLAEFFKEDGPKMVNAAQEFYNGADDLMKQILGYSMKTSDSSTNTVNSITSTASEETMGVVAGYLSRLSQDVSVQRIMQEMFVNGSWPDYIEQVTTANDSLSAIDRSTTAMMEMMRDGNGALYERVENMSRRLDNFANGIDKITVN